MKKKILFVDRFIEYSTEMFNELQENVSEKKNFEIIFVGPDDKRQALFSTKNVKGAKKIWTYGKYLRKLLSYISIYKPNIVHYCFELKTYGPTLNSVIKFPLLLFLTKMKGIKIVLTFHNIFVHKQNSKWKLIDFPYETRIPFFLLKIFETIFMKLVCSLADMIIVEADMGKLSLIEHTNVPSKKITVIPFGVSNKTRSDEIKKEKMIQKFHGKKIILNFGVISPRKSIELIIKAFSEISEKIPEHVLVIAGKSPNEYRNYEERMRQLVRTLNMDEKIIFTGFLQDEEIDVLFEIAESVLFIYQQMGSNSSYSLFIALQHQKPIISTNIETFHEILGKDYDAYVEVDNTSQIADKIFQLSTNAEYRNDLQNELIEISKKFTWKAAVKKHLEIYEST